jgi:MFS family permease
MVTRHRLFQIWSTLTVLWWLGAVFGNGSLILLKFTLGGWRAAFAPFVVTVLIAVGVPVAILFAGWIVTWIAEVPRGPSNKTARVPPESHVRSL